MSPDIDGISAEHYKNAMDELKPLCSGFCIWSIWMSTLDLSMLWIIFVKIFVTVIPL
jgi:hypothetical protein